MFNGLRKIFSSLVSPKEITNNHDEEIQICLAILLAHIIAIDGQINIIERDRISRSLADHFLLSKEDAQALLEKAQLRENEAVEYYAFIAPLKRHLTHEQKRDVVRLFWQAVYADGIKDEYEDNVVWRLSEMLGVVTRERVALKQEVMADIKRNG